VSGKVLDVIDLMRNRFAFDSVNDFSNLKNEFVPPDIVECVARILWVPCVSPPPDPMILLMGTVRFSSAFSSSSKAAGKSFSSIAAACDS
jgi:hypothetical protein